MGLFRTLTYGALLGALYAGVPAQGQQSAAKMPQCQIEMMKMPKGPALLYGTAGNVRETLRTVVMDRKLSDQQKINRLMPIKDYVKKELGGEYAKYVDCVVDFSLFNIAGGPLYKETGRVEPQLTGTFEQRIRTIVGEYRWRLNHYAAMETKINAEAARKQAFNSRKVQNVDVFISTIGNLPDLVTADINIDNREGIRGNMRPIFLGYGSGDVIAFHGVTGPPPGSRLLSKSGRNEIYQANNGVSDGFVLLVKYFSGGATSYSAFNREDIMSYAKFLESPSSTRKMNEVLAFREFSKFLKRLGTGFDGSAKFKVGSGRTVHDYNYQYFGFRGHNNMGPKDVGAAIYFNRNSKWEIDDYYVSDFRRNFSEFAVGGRRQEMHMFSNVGGHGGTHPAGVIEIPYGMAEKFFVILEEK